MDENFFQKIGEKGQQLDKKSRLIVNDIEMMYIKRDNHLASLYDNSLKNQAMVYYRIINFLLFIIVVLSVSMGILFMLYKLGN